MSNAKITSEKINDDAMQGVYPGMLNYSGGNKSTISILPLSNIVIADLEQYQDKTFKTTAFWTSF